MQQQDQESLVRRDAIRDSRATIEDLDGALQKHKKEAAAAIQYHKQCVAGASTSYEKLVTNFDEVMRLSGSMMSYKSPEVKRASAELVKHAAKAWFEVYLDYQQDKSVPSWNRSPQPGPTYFMSGETHYVHIFCAESCGEAAGPSRFSRNLVYSLSERVGGSNSRMILCRLLQTRLSMVRASAESFLLSTDRASARMVPLRTLVTPCKV